MLLGKEMATHSIVLALRIPGTGEPGGCHPWGRTESDTTEATQQQQQQQGFVAFAVWAFAVTRIKGITIETSVKAIFPYTYF